MKDLAQIRAYNLHPVEPECKFIISAVKVYHDHNSTDNIRDYSGNGNTGNTQMKADDEDQIQDDIYDTGDDKIEHWSSGITEASQNGSSKIINGHKRNA